MATKKPVKKAAAAKAPAKKPAPVKAAPAPKDRGNPTDAPVVKTTKSGQKYVERKII